MKKFRIQNVSGGILWCLFIITIIVFAAFFFGGEADPANRLVADTSPMPSQTTNKVRLSAISTTLRQSSLFIRGPFSEN